MTAESTLVPAAELAAKTSRPNPHESAAYRRPARPCSPKRSSFAATSSASPPSAARCRPAASVGKDYASRARTARRGCRKSSGTRTPSSPTAACSGRSASGLPDVHLVPDPAKATAPT